MGLGLGGLGTKGLGLGLDNCLVKGTTGKPKGVTLSHHNLVNNAHQIGHRIGYNEKV